MNHSTFVLAALALSSLTGRASSQEAGPPSVAPALELISRSSADVLGDSWSGGAALSANGRFVSFHSYSANLVTGDTNSHYDIFVRDRAAGVTERVSVDSAGLQASGSSVFPSLSADGRVVAFASYATNLVAGDTNGTWDVFVRDRVGGTTRLVSRGLAGAPGNGSSEDPTIAADGRFVAFRSFATDLAPGPNAAFVVDVFVHDLVTGASELVSVGHQGQAADQMSDKPALSGDGRLVAFQSSATNLVVGDTNGVTDIFVRDRVAGTTVRVSLDSSGAQSNSYSFHSAISRDGRFVAFQSAAALVPGDNDGGYFDVYVHDLVAGQTSAITSGDPTFALNTAITLPSISGDGRRVAFQAAVANPPFLETSQVFVHDRSSGRTHWVSQRWGVEGNGDSSSAILSANGRHVGFESEANNLIDGDDNAAADILVRTLAGP
jgi:Tol biopolymer transport system component